MAPMTCVDTSSPSIEQRLASLKAPQETAAVPPVNPQPTHEEAVEDFGTSSSGGGGGSTELTTPPPRDRAALETKETESLPVQPQMDSNSGPAPGTDAGNGNFVWIQLPNGLRAYLPREAAERAGAPTVPFEDFNAAECDALEESAVVSPLGAM